MADRYLKDKQHYIDLYDLFTIKRCIEVIRYWRKTYREKSDDKGLKAISAGEVAKGFNYLSNMDLYVTKGQRYQDKKETIQNWMERDQKEQEKYDSASEPTGIVCSECKISMTIRIKQLEFFEDPTRVMFLFECPKCKNKKWIYEDGLERESTSTPCEKCKKPIEISLKKESEDKIVWDYSCLSCGFKKTEIDDFKVKRREREKEEAADKELLEKWREEFCLNEEKGQEYVTFIESTEYANEVFEQEKRKYDQSSYQVAINLKRLNIAEVQKLVTEVVEKVGYLQFSFDKPEIGQYVVLRFSALEGDSSKQGKLSTDPLEKLLKETLEDTNWRLMSEGISYRMGYLNGRLRGYESEEDLMQISGQKKAQKPQEDNTEKSRKYGNEPMVRLAKLMGELEGIENTRKERLKYEPEGFTLSSSEGSYNCKICREYKPGDQIWWNLDGMKCLDCHRNIQEGGIPVEICKDEKIWFKESDINYYHGIHGSTRKKLERKGLLHGRELKTDAGTVYCTIYLNSENKDFLEKYPRKPGVKMTIRDLEGKEIEL